MKYELPTLPYPYEALEPVISREIMALHHQKHHAAYVNNLNAALEKYPEIADRPLEELLKNLEAVPEDIRTAVRNHGGGHFNHTLFWELMRPGGSVTPSGSLAEALTHTFGSLDQCKELFSKAAIGRFGSGWGWLSQKTPSAGSGQATGILVIHSTPNQDTPLAEGLTPLLGLDVWEHAYYLQYKSDRAAYVQNWWNVVNWNEVTKRFRN